jgi:hypothetical protein
LSSMTSKHAEKDSTDGDAAVIVVELNLFFACICVSDINASGLSSNGKTDVTVEGAKEYRRNGSTAKAVRTKMAVGVVTCMLVLV